MSKVRGDKRTLDLLDDWTPPEIVRRYDDENVCTSSLRSKIARCVSETLRDSDLSRSEIAKKMSHWLDEDVGENILNAYSSEARENHTMSYLRLLALVQATGDVRPLQMGAELFNHMIVNLKHQRWIDVGFMADRRDQAKEITENCDKEFDAALRNARRGKFT